MFTFRFLKICCISDYTIQAPWHTKLLLKFHVQTPLPVSHTSLPKPVHWAGTTLFILHCCFATSGNGTIEKKNRLKKLYIFISHIEDIENLLSSVLLVYHSFIGFVCLLTLASFYATLTLNLVFSY